MTIRPMKTLAIGDLAPACKLRLERPNEPVTGQPVKNPHAMLASPWPTNSWLLSRRWPVWLAMARAIGDRLDQPDGGDGKRRGR